MSTTKEWGDLSEVTRMVMKSLGNFTPTADASRRTVKGYTYDDEGGSKDYWDSDDLRAVAAACAEVAEWLDARADRGEA